MIEAGKSSTLREMYYISESWGLGKFGSQNESNNLAEDLEVVTTCLREDFKLRPEEDGARMIGNVTIEELNRRIVTLQSLPWPRRGSFESPRPLSSDQGPTSA